MQNANKIQEQFFLAQTIYTDIYENYAKEISYMCRTECDFNVCAYANICVYMCPCICMMRAFQYCARISINSMMSFTKTICHEAFSIHNYLKILCSSTSSLIKPRWIHFLIFNPFPSGVFIYYTHTHTHIRVILWMAVYEYEYKYGYALAKTQTISLPRMLHSCFSSEWNDVWCNLKTQQKKRKRSGEGEREK